MQAFASECQSCLHSRGAANQVVLDPVKEEFVLMRRFRALVPNFKLLGITFDPQLFMREGARKVATEASCGCDPLFASGGPSQRRSS